MLKVLVVDDKKSMLEMIGLGLEELDYIDIKVFESSLKAKEVLNKEYFDLVISDIKMPAVTGMDLLRHCKEVSPETEFILMTAYADIETAIEALRLRAFDFLIKPFSIDELINKVEKVFELKSIKNENLLLKATKKAENRSSFIAKSENMQKIVEQAKHVAKRDIIVNIFGETGTGKEEIAKLIHENSQRKNKPFVKINCSAFSESLLESELFGHKKGSFTGAIEDKKGYFEIANQGTLFLDEVGDISEHIQTKLLRVIQEKQFSRVGDTKVYSTDVRIITATHKDLKQLVEEKKFREDFYYRISVIPIYLPKLKDRKDDIEELLNLFLDQAIEKFELGTKNFSKNALAILKNYKWAGNIREMKNFVERISIMSLSETIEEFEIPNEFKTNSEIDETVNVNTGEYSLTELVDSFEKNLIIKSLKVANNNISKASKELKIPRTTLQNKLIKYGISKNEK